MARQLKTASCRIISFIAICTRAFYLSSASLWEIRCQPQEAYTPCNCALRHPGVLVYDTGALHHLNESDTRQAG